ncbi:hypothetical protein YC2023_002737 [Brassica napus]
METKLSTAGAKSTVLFLKQKYKATAPSNYPLRIWGVIGWLVKNSKDSSAERRNPRRFNRNEQPLPSPKIYLKKPCCKPKQLTPPSRTRKDGSDFFKILHYRYHMKRRLGKTTSNRAEIPDLELEHHMCRQHQPQPQLHDLWRKKTRFCGFWR